MNDIYKIRNSGSIPVADFKIFDSIKILKFSNFVVDNENFTLSMYKEYLDNINSMDAESIISFLKVIKNVEIIDNHSLEMEDSFFNYFIFRKI